MSIIPQSVVAESIEEPAVKTPRFIRAVQLSEQQNVLLSFEADHDGNAQAVYYLYGDIIRFIDNIGWFYWNGKYWERDRLEVKRMVVETLRQRKSAAELAGMEQVAKKSGADTSNIGGTLSQLETLTKAGVDQFDTRDDLLPTPNGIVDLRTGELLPHNPKYGFTWNTTVAYDPQADYRVWVDFLRETVEGGDAEIDFLQMFVGYMLTGSTKEEKLLYIHGPTRSGKGTFTETIQALLPDPIAQEKSFSTFTAKRDEDTNNFDMASLWNARMVFASESSRYQALNEAAIKNMTGGNKQNAAYKGKDSFRFQPKFKIVLSSNHPVNTDVDDNAIWARLIVVPFPHSHLDREDTNLKARFRTEAVQRGVLRWAVEGAVKWYQRGRLVVPETFKQAKEEHKKKLDTVSMWVTDCVEEDQNTFTPSAKIRESYEAWCQENGVEPKRARFFTEALQLRLPHLKQDNRMASYTEYDSTKGPVQKQKRQRGYVGLRIV